MLKLVGALAVALVVSACAVQSQDREFLALASNSDDSAIPKPRLIGTRNPIAVLLRDTDQPVTLLTASTRDVNDPKARSSVISYAKQTVGRKDKITKENVDQNGFFAAVRGQLEGGLFTQPGDVLVFVHGFNNTEEDALSRAKLLTNVTAFRGVPVAFTWPSNGGWKGSRYYLYDLQSSTFSRDELAALLQSLANEGSVGRIHLIAHSMGAWLSMEALRQASMTKQDDLLSKLASIILLAPDVDLDVFDSQLAAIGPLARRITVFAGTDDKALKTSAALAADRRLGNESVKGLRDYYGSSGIYFVDTTKEKTRDWFHHFKGDSPTIALAIANQMTIGADAAYAQR